MVEEVSKALESFLRVDVVQRYWCLPRRPAQALQCPLLLPPVSLAVTHWGGVAERQPALGSPSLLPLITRAQADLQLKHCLFWYLLLPLQPPSFLLKDSAENSSCRSIPSQALRPAEVEGM